MATYTHVKQENVMIGIAITPNLAEAFGKAKSKKATTLDAAKDGAEHARNVAT